MRHYKTTLIILATLCISLALADDFKTVNGKEYKNARINRVEPDGIVISFSGGIVKIPFTELATELQEKYHYDREAAKKFAAETADAQKQLYQQTQAEKERQQKIREADEQIKENEKRIAANEASNRALIDNAIANHDLFIGMTPAQCIQSRGEPDKINVTTTDKGRHEQWVYSERRYWVSSQTNGGTALATVNDHVSEGWRYIATCYVYFDNGILTTIQD